MKFLLVGVEFCADQQRHVMKLLVAFHNFAKDLQIFVTFVSSIGVVEIL